MADEPVVKLTGEQTQPLEQQRQSDPAFAAQEAKKSAAWQRRASQVSGQRLRPLYEFPRVVTGKDYRPQTPPRHQGETAQQMPYYSQLTGFEQKLYEVLPGFSQSTVGQALAKLNDTWVGKALGYIDVLAEGAERTSSLAAQFWNANSPEERDELTRNLTSAWYAGSLGADMTNLPTIDYDDDGRVTGVSIPDVLPGGAGLTRARQEIQTLVDGGATHSEALQQVKSTYYDDLGALQIRAQLYDTYFHVLADPINYVFPMIKPVERIKTLSYFAGANKWADAAITSARGVLKVGDNLPDIIKVGKGIGYKGNELLAFNKAADAGDIGKLTKMIGKSLDDVGLTSKERIALNITGGKDPFKVPSTRWEKFYDKMPWRLTPESRAYEYITVIQDNVGKYIVESLDDPYDIYNTISRAAAGAVGPELGHAFLTIEGRAVQGALKGFEAEVLALLGDFKALENERGLLSTIAQAANKTPEEIMGLMKTGDFGAVSKLSKVPVDELEVLVKMLDGKPFSTKMFKLETMGRLAEWTGKQGALMFGVKQRGLVQKLAQAVKSAETLAFLRINPGYMIRNVLNNEMTLIARGAGITLDDLNRAGKFFDLEMEPFRFATGYGAAGDVYAVVGGKGPSKIAGETLNEILRGKEGRLDKITDWFSEKKPFGKFDMGAVSAKAEASASRRAFTTSYIRAWEGHWKPGKAFDELSSYLPTDIQETIATKLGDDWIRGIENKVASARTPAELKKIYSDNLNISINNILDEASAELAYDVTKSMPPEFLATIRDGLEEAAQKGTVREFTSGVRKNLTDNLEEAMPRVLKEIRENVAKQVTIEGPASFPKILGKVQEEMDALGIYHARRTEEIAEMVRAMPDKGLANKLWVRYQDEADAYYKRMFNKIDATMQGFRSGVTKDKALAPFADVAVENFKQLKSGWKGFWKSKRTRSNAYFQPKYKGPRWEDIAKQTSDEFDKMTKLEAQLQKNIDNAVVMALPEAERGRYLAGQFQLAELRKTDKDALTALFDELKNKTAFEREQIWKRAVKERYERFEAIQQQQHINISAIEGDPKAVTQLDEAAAAMPEEELARLDVEIAEELEGLPPPVAKTYQSGSYENLTKATSYPDDAVLTDEWWLTRGHPGLDAIERSTLTQSSKPPMMFADIPKDAQKYLENYVGHVTGQMGDARYASTRFAEFGRDAALLNYNRRYNFNTWLGTIMPFEFWTTHSMMKWALHSIDRPAMLTSYLRMQKMMLASGAPGQALPARLKGQFRIPFPWLPDWAGDTIFFDPLKALIPFDNFAYGYENEMQRRTGLEGKTMFILNDMAENNQADQAEVDDAIASQAGPLWEKAEQQALDDNEDLRFNVWDFASMMSAPHAPLDWAVKSLQGRPEDIGPFMPASRTIKGVAGLLGVDWDRHPMNMEARVRTTLGLPAFDQWDDYRVDRMLSNMTALGEITKDNALRAMIDREGPAYDEAIKKANFEFGIGAVGSTFGIPAKAFPEGEFLQRSLADDYQNAWKMYNEGNDEALKNFNRLHPEYEARLALHKPPEERLKRFLTDNMWDIWNDLPSLTKWELKDQLGENFVKKMEPPYADESITLDDLQMWLKLMGGDPPGTLESEPAPLDLADPEVAWRVQVYYDTKWTYFPKDMGIKEMQDEYYALTDKKAKKAYRDSHPDMISYWDWRRDWMHRNPETVPYLTEKEYEFNYSSPQAERRAAQPQPWITWDEWTQYMGPNMANLMEDHFVRGYDIPPTFQDKADELGQQLGIGFEDMLGLMRESILGQETPPQIEQQSQPVGTPQQIEQQTTELQEMRMPPSEGGRQEVNQYTMGELLYGFKRDPLLTDHAKKFLASTVKIIGTSKLEKDDAVRYGYFQNDRDWREHSSYLIATTDLSNINLMRHEAAHALDRKFKISSSQEFQDLFWPYIDADPMEAVEAMDDPWGRPERAFEGVMKYYMPSQWRKEIFADLFAQLADNPEEVPSELKKIYRPYIIFP